MNPYEVLGVSQKATDDQIKKAYRKKAKKFHPDSNPGDETVIAPYQEIVLAYEVLSDPERREYYDKTGEVKESRGRDDSEEKLLNVIVPCLQFVVKTITESGCKVEEENVVEEMKKAIGGKLAEASEKKGNIEKAKKAIEKTAGRFETKEPKNLMEEVVTAQLREVEKQLEVAKSVVDQYQAAIDFLKNYKYRTESKVKKNLDGSVTMTTIKPYNLPGSFFTFRT